MPRAASGWMAEVAQEEPDARELAERLAAVADPEVDVLPEHRWIWRAWWRLHDERPWRGGGMGPPLPGRIPWSAVVAWAQVHDFGADDLDLLEIGIAAMDAEWLEWQEDQRRIAATAR